MLLLSPADAANTICHFVDEVLEYLEHRKYSVSACPCDIYPAYNLFLLVEVQSPTCVTYEDECLIKSNVVSTPIVDCTTPTPCSNQASITLSAQTSSCSGLAKIDHSFCSCAFPKFTPTKNSIYVESEFGLKVYFTGSCNQGTAPTEYTVINGGTTSGGSSDSYKSNCGLKAIFLGTSVDLSQYYFHQMVVQYTDSLGSPAGTTTLLLHPLLSPYLDDNPSCSGCSSVLPAELIITHPNFSSAFATLMDNVSIALFGETGHHNISAAYTNNNLEVTCLSQHQPSGYLFGFPKFGATPGIPNDRLVIVNDANFPYKVPPTPFCTPSKYYLDHNSTAPNGYTCADMTGILVEDQTSSPVPAITLDYRNIVLSSPLGNTPLQISGNYKSDCSPTKLIATVSTTETISEYYWEDDTDIISNELTVTVTDPGTYYFTIILANGCTITEQIIIS